MAKGKLTPKQQRFIEEYLIDLNGTQAAIRAGYSPKRADAIAFENLRKPGIQQALQDVRQKQAAKAGETVEKHLQTLADLRDEARTLGQVAAAVKAEENRGKVLGFYMERHEVLERKIVVEFADEEI